MTDTSSLPIELIRDYLSKYEGETAGDFRAFEAALARANVIYDNTLPEVRLRTFRDTHPHRYGDNVRDSLFGILEEEATYLDAICATYGLKLKELATGISEGIGNNKRFRLAVLSCRTLYEEAAAAKYYGDKAEAAIPFFENLGWLKYFFMQSIELLNVSNNEAF